MKERRASSSEVGPCHARREAGICITLVLSAMYDTRTGSIHAGAGYRQPAEQGTECIFRQRELLVASYGSRNEYRVQVGLMTDLDFALLEWIEDLNRTGR